MAKPKDIVPEMPEETKPETETPLEVETKKKVKKIKRKESKPELVVPESEDIEETSEVQVTEESHELVEGDIEMAQPKEIVPEFSEETKPEIETPTESETVKKVKKIKRKESTPELVAPRCTDIVETSEVQVTEESHELVEGDIEMAKPKDIVPEMPEETKPETETSLEVETKKKVKKIKRKESKPELVVPESKDIDET